MRPSQVILTLEAVANSIPRSLERNGTRLSGRDAETVNDVYQQWILLLIDLGYLSHETFAIESRRILIDLYEKDTMTILHSFSDCLQEVYNARLGKYNRGFKALCKTISPRLYSLIQADVLSASDGDVYSMRRLVQAFAYPSRISLVDIDLETECLVDYRRTETNMETSYSSALTSTLNKIIRRWFKGIDLADLDFSHGPGGVAGLGRTSLENKYFNLTSDPLIRYAFPTYEVPSLPRYDSAGSRLQDLKVEMTRISSTIFVPKSYKTFRTISMEPPTLMFLQQGVWSRIDQHVNGYNYLRKRIGFHDQVRNQELAQEGSLLRNYATIDLSAASDSVSWELVKRLFKGTKLLRYLFACRSTHSMLPDGSYIELKKFAPMGSALCFPVETIIFAAICEFVTHEHNFSGDYSVFGDDIIVPTPCTQDVFYILERLGFTPNESKSFFHEGCGFRESCGGEYFDGFDVTPLRISRKYTSELTDVGCVGISEMMNICLSKGYKHVRALLWRKLRTNKDYDPFFAPNAMLSDNYTNYHLRKRWSKRYQRVEMRATQLVVRYDERNEDVAYYDYLLRKSSKNTSPAKTHLDKLYEEYGNFVPFYDIVSPNETGKPVVNTRRRWMSAPYDASDDEFVMQNFLRYHCAMPTLRVNSLAT